MRSVRRQHGPRPSGLLGVWFIKHVKDRGCGQRTKRGTIIESRRRWWALRFGGPEGRGPCWEQPCGLLDGSHVRKCKE
jgi:hypothetical protein